MLDEREVLTQIAERLLPHHDTHTTGSGIQKALASGLRPFNTFGCNEPALIHIHEALAQGSSVSAAVACTAWRDAAAVDRASPGL